MKDIGWIDLEESKDHKSISITVRAFRELNSPLQLAVEEFQPEEERWSDTNLRIKDFSHRKVGNRHEYYVDWKAPEAHTLIRFVYFDEDEFVASDEHIIINGIVDQGHTRIIRSKGKAPRRPRRVIGRTFLTSPCVIRAVEAFTIVENYYGGELFRSVPWPGWMNYLRNKTVLLMFFTGPKKAKKLDFTYWWLKTNSDGYLYSPNYKGGIKDPYSTILQFPSRYFTVEKGRMAMQFAWFCALISNSRGEIVKRMTVIRDSFRQPNITTRIHTVQTMADSFINNDGSVHDLVLFQHSKRLRRDVEGTEVLQLFLPLKHARVGKMMRIFERYVEDDYSGGFNLIDELKNFPEITENDIYKYNYDFLTAPKNWELGGDLVRRVRRYFYKHPDDLSLLARMSVSSFLRELDYCLTILLRDKYFQDVGGASRSLTEDEYKNKWKLSQKEADKFLPKAIAMFAMGMHEHLRLDIGYTMGREILQSIRNFFQNFFEEKDESTITLLYWYEIKPTPKKDCSEKLGMVAANLGIKYFMGYRQVKRSKNPQEAQKTFRKNFEVNLLPLGIYEGDAEDIVDILHKHMNGENSQQIAKYIDSLHKGTDAEKLRNRIREPMIQAHMDAHRLWKNLFYETQVDIYLQYSLFLDYPLLTKTIYDAYRIRLDPKEYPKGFRGGREPTKPVELRRLTFGEFAIYKCGSAFEKRGSGIKYLAKFFEFILMLGSLELLATKGMERVLINLTQGLANSLVDFGKGWMETHDAYAKAVAGLGDLETAKKKKATFYFQTIFNVLNVGFGTYSDVLKKSNPMSWAGLDGIYSKVITEERVRTASYFASQVVARSARKVIRSKTWRTRLHKGLQGLVRFSLNHAGSFAYAKVLNKTGLDKISVKDFLELLYFEAVLKAEIEGDLSMLEKLEENLKDIAETLERIEKIQ